MRSEITQSTARKQLYRYFVRTLRALPAELALSLFHPEIPQAQLHNGVALPCEDTDQEFDSEFFDIAYWVTGTTPDTVDEYFDLIVRSWNEFGWPTRTDRSSRPRAAYTRTSDRFGLSVRQSVDGSLSISGSTPPFAADSAVGKPLPQFIEHPLGTPAEAGPATPSTETDKHRSNPWTRKDSQ